MSNPNTENGAENKRYSLSIHTDDLAGIDSVSDCLKHSNVVGIGEGAHFVKEFSAARITLVRHLLDCHDFDSIALECGHYQAEKLNSWIENPDSDCDISRFSGPLTVGLYGSFLIWLKSYLKESGRKVRIHGVDIPNTLVPSDEYEFLNEELCQLDPSMSCQLKELGAILSCIDGESAVLSSMSWSQITPSERDRAFTIVTRLRIRYQALSPELDSRSSKSKMDRVYSDLACLQYTLEALQGMSALFSGHSVEAETSARDYFIAQSVKRHMENNSHSKLILMAHNNHIQKMPVVFSGQLAGIPAGQHLANLPGYRAIALTHVGETVPEMDFPDTDSSVGFSVVEESAAPVGIDSVENLMPSPVGGDNISILPLAGASPRTIRSQSSLAEVDVAKAFDLVVCTMGATKDVMVKF